MYTYSASRKARQHPISEGAPASFPDLETQLETRFQRKSPTARGDKLQPTSCTSCPARTSWASAMEKGCEPARRLGYVCA